jgi:F-type H+-transporting ATPase subunit epsilon
MPVAEMSVELVAVERPVWSGKASSVFAETTVGELGILPGHTPLLGFGGFLSVTGDKVSVLAEAAELADEIDAQAARDTLSQAGDDPDAASARARATARLKAAGETG